VKPVLVTGGTGTLGQQLVPLLLSRRKRYGISRIRILSCNEPNQVKMAQRLRGKPVDFMLGNVRDKERMLEATKDCRYVFHLAAIKGVDKLEYDPFEGVLTNIIGTQNVAKACQFNGVEKAILTSTDKAVAPLNFYGNTKACAERLWVQANVGSWETKFAALRYGNVFGSNGSAISKWNNGGRLVTDPTMTRFFISQVGAARLVLDALDNCKGGETFIPKMKSTTIGELFDVVVGGSAEVIGLRPGEKMHETLITQQEASLCTEYPEYYIRWPSHIELFPCKRRGNDIALEEWGYTSDTAERFTQKELRELCQSL